MQIFMSDFDDNIMIYKEFNCSVQPYLEQT